MFEGLDMTRAVVACLQGKMNRNQDLRSGKKISSSLPAELERKHFNEKDNLSSHSANSKISSIRCATHCAVEANPRNYGLDTNVKNDGNEDVFTLHSWNSAANIRPIENDEWQVFLLRSMEELMTGQLDCLRNHNLVSVVVAPLRNSNASCKVLEYVANMLSLPFVVDGPSEKDVDSIKQVYLEIKVIPNLIYASKIIAKSKSCDINSSSQSVPLMNEILAPISELNADELQALECIYLLICHLVHSGIDFIIQFCDAAAILNAVPLMQQLLLLGGRKMRIVTDILAILNLILHESPENSDLVEQIVLGISDNEGDFTDLSKLLTHPNQIIRSRTCQLIKRLCASKISMPSILVPKLYQDLNALLNDSSNSVRTNAEEVLKEFKMVQGSASWK